MMSTAQYEGLSRNASDLVKIIGWAQNDLRLLGRLYLRYPRASRIDEGMACRLLQEERDAWRGGASRDNR